jgi:hypothetical protein
MAVDGTAVEGYGLFGYMYFAIRRILADGAKNPIAEPGLIEHLVVRPGNVDGGAGKPVLPFALLAAQNEGLNELVLDAAWFNCISLFHCVVGHPRMSLASRAI